MKGEDVGPCPYCGLELAVSTDPPAVMHAVPMCKEFEEVDPLTFVKQVNARRKAEGTR